MSSPLLEQANAYLFLPIGDDVTVVNGRLTVASTQGVVFHAFLKREDAAASNGAPSRTTQTTNPLPGVDGEGIRYRGYVLRHGVVEVSEWAGELPDEWTDITAFLPVDQVPGRVLRPGRRGQVIIGAEIQEPCTLEISTGRYGGLGIDELLYQEIGGIPVSVVVGRVFGA